MKNKSQYLASRKAALDEIKSARAYLDKHGNMSSVHLTRKGAASQELLVLVEAIHRLPGDLDWKLWVAKHILIEIETISRLTNDGLKFKLRELLFGNPAKEAALWALKHQDSYPWWTSILRNGIENSFESFCRRVLSTILKPEKA